MWLRGQRNESSQLPRIAETLATLRNQSLAQFCAATTANALLVLGLHENGACAR